MNVPDLKIAYWTRDEGGCTYYRQVWPMEKIEELKLAQVLRVDRGDGEAQHLKAGYADVHQHSRVISGPFMKAIRGLQRNGIKVAFDLDDALLPDENGQSLIHPLSPHYADWGLQNCSHKLIDGTEFPTWKDGEKGFSIARNKDRIELVKEVLSIVDMMTTTTEILAEHYRPHTKHVEVVENFIDTNLLKKPEFRKRDDIRIFWQGGSSHFADICMIVPVVQKILEDYKHVKLYTFGQWFPGTWDKLPKARVTHFNWVNPQAFYYRLMTLDYDIALVPLTDAPFNRCKSGIKLLEQAALGIPSVVSMVTPYKELYTEDNFVLIEENDLDSWYTGIATLIEDRRLRERIGEKARRWVVQDWDLNTNAVKWTRCYEALRDGDFNGSQRSTQDSRIIRYFSDSGDGGAGERFGGSERISPQPVNGRSLPALHLA